MDAPRSSASYPCLRVSPRAPGFPSLMGGTLKVSRRPANCVGEQLSYPHSNMHEQIDRAIRGSTQPERDRQLAFAFLWHKREVPTRISNVG